jgi:hypothetical protein
MSQIRLCRDVGSLPMRSEAARHKMPPLSPQEVDRQLGLPVPSRLGDENTIPLPSIFSVIRPCEWIVRGFPAIATVDFEEFELQPLWVRWECEVVLGNGVRATRAPLLHHKCPGYKASSLRSERTLKKFHRSRDPIVRIGRPRPQTSGCKFTQWPGCGEASLVIVTSRSPSREVQRMHLQQGTRRHDSTGRSPAGGPDHGRDATSSSTSCATCG